MFQIPQTQALEKVKNRAMISSSASMEETERKKSIGLK